MNKLRKKVLLFLGLEYIINTKTKEVHRLRHEHSNCNLKLMSKRNRKYVTMKRMWKYFSINYNGCRYCFKSEDKG